MDAIDQPNSICHIQPIHMYALPDITADAGSIPFKLLAGETVVHMGNCVNGLVVVTNFRLYLQSEGNQYHIPLGLIDNIEIKELFFLQLSCKDARTYRCTFENNESALEWYVRLTEATGSPRHIEQIFAFYYYAWTKEIGGDEATQRLANQDKYIFNKEMFENEMRRMQFQGDSWRISKANENYKVCPTYPQYLLVPSCINDEMIENVAAFRSSRRIPAVVWRHTKNGAVIARCSQPEVGWFGWRSKDDEDLLKAISDSCNFDSTVRTTTTTTNTTSSGASDKEDYLSRSPGSMNSVDSLQITGEVAPAEKKLLIMDARSYASAVANRARGGGCECSEYYPNCEIQFMSLANIHKIRTSFQALRQLCTTSADLPNWLSQLDSTKWLSHMSGLIKAAITLATAVEKDARPVLVHCSDGWDRTPQIVALAELLLDPYYRTITGFRVLIEREWLAFGHKFADRCGHSGASEDVNERCPVFLQWLDCVHQLVTQFPISFEFSQNYLIKLAQHTYSNLYGTFLCNTQKQRSKVVHGRTLSVWEFLDSPKFRNHLYAPQSATGGTLAGGRVLWPKYYVRNLRLWSELYLGSLEANFNGEEGSRGDCPGPPEPSGPVNMSKTRSYGDLINPDVCHPANSGGRRSSDPSINRERNLVPHENPSAKEGARTDPSIVCALESDFQPSDLEDNQSEYNQDPNFDIKSDQLEEDGEDGEDDVDAVDNDWSTSPFDNNKKTDSDGSDKSESEDNTVDMAASLRNVFLENNSLDGDNDNDDNDKDNDLLLCDTASSIGLNVRKSNANIAGASRDDEDGRSGEGASKKYDDGQHVAPVLHVDKSVETSTETLVSDNVQPGSSPKEFNGFEEIHSPIENIDSCDQYNTSKDAGAAATGAQRTLRGWHKSQLSHCQLGDDGLVPVRSPVQERLDQISEEHRKKVEQLERELHLQRQALLKKVCPRCNDECLEKPDDNVSVVESAYNASEGQASAGESQRSDLSWVDVAEHAFTECQATLWVPDHAVSKCTGCGIEFWLGRRRHHCRKCGKIFCADCSEHATPLPAEQLYNPVRVCSGCYSELHNGERPLCNVKLTESLPSRYGNSTNVRA